MILSASLSSRQRIWLSSAARPSVQRFLRGFITALASSLLLACHAKLNESYRGTLSNRVIEFRSNMAYITEGGSTQAFAYRTEDNDTIVLQMPFTNVALRRMPDGSLYGMGENLVRVESSSP
ncbi:hypothetical protein [Terriglobus roseus]|uniref:Uncharacterized protein n=1 Tax=Terriglobus roseus TaxID=392734 RepID=A0A1G7G219_9BACT|nr:hypothetical protein [Terriglobus roseus]SDE82188.1 hypothetical protein SAMN05444167_0528 [Terriglobus roseus]